MGEVAELGGHADGVRRPVLFILVQPLCRAELQEPFGACPRPTGGDHRRGRHRDTTQLALPAFRKALFLSLVVLLYKQNFEFVDFIRDF